MPDQQPTSQHIRVTVTACPDHPNTEPTMPAATCTTCGRHLEVTAAVIDEEQA